MGEQPYMDRCLVLEVRVKELEAALRDVQNDAGNWLASDLQGRIAALVGPGGTSPSGYPATKPHE